MTYTPTVWKDETGVGDGTIITAARLNNIESGIGTAQGIVGPAGPAGPTGSKGDTGYETAPIGSVLAWSGRTLPAGFVLADGARYPQGPYPQGYAFAGQEVAAGNPLWTQRVSDTTFTVPDLRDRFLLTAGATYPLGTPASGEAAHRLTLAESPSHSHYVQTMINAVASNQAGNNNDAPLNARDGSYRQVGFKAAVSEGGDQLHNNMPPYVVIAQIVKVAGVTISAGAITGPPGAAGAAGGQSYIQEIGDGASRAFTVTHGFGTRAVQVSVYTTATPYSEVTAEIEHIDANTVVVRTSTSQPVPTTGQYIVAVAAPGTTLTSSALMDTWHTVGPQGGPEPAFQNTWSNYNPPSDQALQFRKDPFGRVLLRGIVKNGTVGQTIFNLPVGYRPPAPVRITVLAGGTLGYMVIDSVTGYVLLSTGSNAWVTLDTVEFDTDSVSEYGRGPKGDKGDTGPAGSDVPEVATLPNPGSDGQVVDLLVDGAGAYGGPFLWRCRYRASTPGSAKWHVLGGAALFKEVLNDESLGVNYNVFIALGTAGPSIALPAPGDYIVGVGGTPYSVGATYPNVLWMSYDIGVTGAVAADGLSLAVTGSNIRFPSYRERVKTGLGAVTLTAKYMQNNDQSHWFNRFLVARPLRIGP